MSVKESKEKSVMPMLALRGLVLFPGMTLDFEVGRQISYNALKFAADSTRCIYLVSQKDIKDEEPTQDNVYGMGCVARITQMFKKSDKEARVIVEGLYRAKHNYFTLTNGMLMASVAEVKDTASKARPVYVETLVRRIKDEFGLYAANLKRVPADMLLTVQTCDDLSYLTNYVAFNINTTYDDQQFLLEQTNPVKRGRILIDVIKKETEILKIDRKLSETVKNRLDENQKEYYLREQMKAISEELYGTSDEEDEIDEYSEKIKSLNAPEYVKEKLNNELGKLAKMPTGAHEAVVVRNYLDTCIKLPWNSCTDSKINVKKAAKILDRDFYGMEKVKQRILEMLSVYSLAPDINGQIICLAGPPGVGKTSIGKTIAECTGRRYARVSLGGVRDEAEIRGHRKTYVAAMAGKIITAIQNAGSSNPLILLDEVDKLSNDYKGDPSSALLEVLDPEQNATFTDHFIEMPYDLSRVLFITTANNIDAIPAPLLDRMEVIELTSYTREEKFNIAKKHIVAKQLARHGLNKKMLNITDKAIYGMIDFYTREAGVRRLEQTIASVCRKTAKMIAEDGAQSVTVDLKMLEHMLGVHKYMPESLLKNDEVGIINGLAWTSVGGELMQLEVAVCQGTGKTELTGSLGDVMKESAKAAITYVRLNARNLGVEPDFYKTQDIHIHATQAAVSKDGPSAGVTITTALVSALTNIPVKRDVAMTGEVTIKGRVLPIGGLKEKSMAAYRAGIKTVFIPAENLPDLEEIDDAVKNSVKFVPVDTVDTVINNALQYPVTSGVTGFESVVPAKRSFA